MGPGRAGDASDVLVEIAAMRAGPERHGERQPRPRACEPRYVRAYEGPKLMPVRW